MKICEIIKEEATTGSTMSGNIAPIANTCAAYSKKPKKQKPTDNALNKNDSLFGAGVIKRNELTPLAALHSGKLV
jgi:hypothetical protein